MKESICKKGAFEPCVQVIIDRRLGIEDWFDLTILEGLLNLEGFPYLITS